MDNTSYDKLLKDQYEAQLNAQKEKLSNEYNTSLSNLDAQKQENQKITDENLNRVMTDARKRELADAEYYAAAGLTSGAKAQARIARDNQVMADLAAIRATQQSADMELERTRGLLAQEYESAIKQAQENNDMNLAEALYQQATEEDERLRKQQETYATLRIDELGDYTLWGKLYGLSDAEIEELNKNSGYVKPKTPTVPTVLPENSVGTPDYKYDPTGAPNQYEKPEEKQTVTTAQISDIQKTLKIPATGIWDANSAEAARALFGLKNAPTAAEVLQLIQAYLQ